MENSKRVERDAQTSLSSHCSTQLMVTQSQCCFVCLFAAHLEYVPVCESHSASVQTDQNNDSAG